MCLGQEKMRGDADADEQFNNSPPVHFPNFR